jgi:hypothetical protein
MWLIRSCSHQKPLFEFTLLAWRLLSVDNLRTRGTWKFTRNQVCVYEVSPTGLQYMDHVDFPEEFVGYGSYVYV